MCSPPIRPPFTPLAFPKAFSFSITFLNVHYQTEKARWLNYEVMRAEYEGNLQNLLKDATLRVVHMEDGMLKIYLRTCQPLVVFSELCRCDFRIPTRQSDMFFPEHIQVSIPWISHQYLHFSEPDQLRHFISVIGEDSKRNNELLRLSAIASSPSSVLSPDFPSHEVTPDELKPICEAVLSYSMTTRPAKIHYIDLGGEPVGEIRWEASSGLHDWLHIVVDTKAICISFDTPYKDECVLLSDPLLASRVADATSSLSVVASCGSMPHRA